MNSFLHKYIRSVMVSAVAMAVVDIQTKYKSKMLSLREMIEKSLLLKESFSTTSASNPNVSSKLFLPADLLSKFTKRWNQIDFGYFELYLIKAHGEDIIVAICKNVYYRNILLFLKHLQRLITFKRAIFVKANIVTFIEDSALEC